MSLIIFDMVQGWLVPTFFLNTQMWNKKNTEETSTQSNITIIYHGKKKLGKVGMKNALPPSGSCFHFQLFGKECLGNFPKLGHKKQ